MSAARPRLRQAPVGDVGVQRELRVVSSENKRLGGEIATATVRRACRDGRKSIFSRIESLVDHRRPSGLRMQPAAADESEQGELVLRDSTAVVLSHLPRPAPRTGSGAISGRVLWSEEQFAMQSTPERVTQHRNRQRPRQRRVARCDDDGRRHPLPANFNLFQPISTTAGSSLVLLNEGGTFCHYHRQSSESTFMYRNYLCGTQNRAAC